jgi:hypothetical protein
MADFELKMTRGDGPTFPITFDADVPDDAVVWFTAKHSHADDDAEAVIALSTTAGGVERESGTSYLVTIPAGDTAALTGSEVTVLVADVQLREDGGEPQTVAHGFVVVRPDVTRAT